MSAGRSGARWASKVVAVLAAACALAQAPPDPIPGPAASTGSPTAFSSETLAPGVVLFRPAGSGFAHTNSLVVERQDGLLVVDAQPTVDAAWDLLAAITVRWPSTPIRYLVLSHPHSGAAGGAAAFPDAALRVASRGFRDAVADPGFGFDADRAARGEPAADSPRPRVTLVLFGRTRLEDPRNPIVLMPLPPAHSPGDLLVMLPEAGVVEAGGLPFPDRNPYGADADVAGWLAQLNQLIGVAPRSIVGLRGPAQGPSELAAQRDALAWVRSAVDDAFAHDVPAETIPAAVLAEPRAARHFDLGARPSFARILVERAVEEARARRRSMGLE